MNKGLKIFLVITAILLTLAISWSLKGPIEFNKERDKRYISVISQLQDIGAVQKEYLYQTGKFASTFDTLIAFTDTAIYVIKERKDSTYYVTNAQGIKVPKDIIVYRELGRVPLKDSIFKGRSYKDLGVKKVGDQKPIHLETYLKYKLNEDSTDYTTESFFKAFASKREILEGLNKNFVTNEITEGKGIQDTVVSIGSLIMQSTRGNWSPEQDLLAKELKEKEKDNE